MRLWYWLKYKWWRLWHGDEYMPHEVSDIFRRAVSDNTMFPEQRCEKHNFTYYGGRCPGCAIEKEAGKQRF